MSARSSSSLAQPVLRSLRLQHQGLDAAVGGGLLQDAARCPRSVSGGSILEIGYRHVHRRLLRHVAFQMQHQRRIGGHRGGAAAAEADRGEDQKHGQQACEYDTDDESEQKSLHKKRWFPAGLPRGLQDKLLWRHLCRPT